MIDFDFNYDCCGCSACIDACPKNCIKQTTNKLGFIVPEVAKSVCVDCHLCEKVCPVLKLEKIEYQDRKLFSAINKNDEQRAAGSSGSIFYLLAEKVICDGGIVFGAAFDDKLQLRHTSAESMEELRPLLKSKYLQSNTLGVYKKVKEQLKTDRKVLFVGTPCQCNALYKFLGCKKPENLLMADFICHGVPSQELFNKSITLWEKKHNCKIEQFEFRHKRPDCVHSFKLIAKEMKAGDHYFEFSGKYDKFPFYNMFKSHIGYRYSCYKCQYATVDRVSDLTLADFWHIEELDESVSIEDFNQGYSMIVINSNKGTEKLGEVSVNTIKKEFPTDYAIKYNYAYAHSTIQPIKDMGLKTLYTIVPVPVLSNLYIEQSTSIISKLFRRITSIMFKFIRLIQNKI